MMLKVISANGIIAKMKNQKINYDKVMRKMISQWERKEMRPSILIHIGIDFKEVNKNAKAYLESCSKDYL